MNFDQLITFYTVAQKKSYTKASKELGKAKSAISRQINLLEKRFGARLFYKVGKEFALTEKGGIIYEKTKKILFELKTFDHLDDSLTEVNLTIASTHAILSTWLSNFLHKFCDQYPNWNFQLMASNEPLDAIFKYADICVRPQVAPRPDCSQFFLKKWMLRLYASQAYLDQHGTPKTLQDLDHHKIMVFSEKNHVYPSEYVYWPLYKGTKFHQPRKAAVETNSLHTLYNLIANGVGIGALAEDSPLLKNYSLIPILPHDIFQEIEVFLIIPNVVLNDQRILIFKQFLEANL